MQPPRHKRPLFPQTKWRTYAQKQQPETSRPLSDILKRCGNRTDNILHQSQIASPAWDGMEWDEEYGGEYTSEKVHWFRRFIALFVLLPLSIIFIMSLCQQLIVATNKMDVLLSVPVWYTMLGCFAWMVLAWSRLFTKAFIFFYVLGHELTHALATFLSLGWVSGMDVSLEGGYIKSTKNNIFIALSPYFIPLWALLWAGFYALINWYHPIDDFQWLLYGGIGFWWAFHLFWTIWIIPRDQPDLRENDTFFSLMIICLANMILIGSMLVLCGLVHLDQFAYAFAANGQKLWYMMRDLLMLLV